MTARFDKTVTIIIDTVITVYIDLKGVYACAILYITLRIHAHSARKGHTVY
jgi:hypothetical protein